MSLDLFMPLSPKIFYFERYSAHLVRYFILMIAGCLVESLRLKSYVLHQMVLLHSPQNLIER